MKHINLVLLVASALVLQACASGVQRQASSTKPKAATISQNTPLRNFVITLTPEAIAKEKETPQFNLADLKRAITANLAKENLLKPINGQSQPSLEVSINDMRVRSTGVAMMAGFLAGADSISGEVKVKTSSSVVIDTFGVSSSYAMGGLAMSGEEMRMNWLYNAFAEELVKELKVTEDIK
jgi:hypothetical protein